MFEYKISKGVLMECYSDEEEIVVPAGVISTKESVFAQDDNIMIRYLRRIEFSQGFKKLGVSAFSHWGKSCERLEEVILPEGTESIGDYAFDGCSALRHIDLPNTLVHIGMDAFRDSGLVSITIPDSVTCLKGNPFSGCLALESIDVSPDHPTLMFKNGMLIDKKTKTLICCLASVEEIDFSGSGFKKIGTGAFRGCQHLKTVEIPEGVVSIGDCAFMNCKKLEKLVIPASVNKLGNMLVDIKGIREIFFEGVIPTTREVFPPYQYLASEVRPDMRICAPNMPTANLLPSRRAYALGYIADPQRETHFSQLQKSEYDDWIKKSIQSILTCIDPVDVLNMEIAHGAFKTEKSLVTFIEKIEKTKLTADQKKQIEAIKKDAKTIVKRYKEGATAPSAEQEKGSFVMEKKILMGIEGKNAELVLPDVKADVSALSNADVETIVIDGLQKHIDLQWLAQAQWSPAIRKIKLSAQWLQKQLPEELILQPEKLNRWYTNPEIERQKVCCQFNLAESVSSRVELIDCMGIRKNKMDSLIGFCCEKLNMSAEYVFEALENEMDDNQKVALLVKGIMQKVQDMPEELTPEAFNSMNIPESVGNMIGDAMNAIFGVSHMDEVTFAGRDMIADYLVAELLMLRLLEKPEVGCVEMQLLKLLDQEKLCAFLNAHCGVEDNGPYDTVFNPAMISIYARLCDLKAATHILSVAKKMERASMGGKRLDAARCVLENLPYNERNEVLLLLDKKGMLDKAAELRHMSEKELHEYLLAAVDTAMDEHGEITLDYGPRKFIARLQPRMIFAIEDVAKNKILKNLPKAASTDNAKKAAKAADTFKKLKASVKTVAEIRMEGIKAMYHDGTSMPLSKWNLEYTGNAICRILAQGILWGVYEKNDTLIQAFRMLQDGTFADVNDAPVKIKSKDRIGVVDGAQLSETELNAWRNLFVKNELYQPMKQLALPVCLVPQEYIEDRYMGCEISAGVMAGAFGYNASDREVPSVESTYIQAWVGMRHAVGNETGPVNSVEIKEKLPTMDKLTDHQKRLWNQSVIFMDSYLKPGEQKVKADIAADRVDAVRIWIDQKLITKDNVKDMLDAAIDAKATNCTAYLMQLKQDWLGTEGCADDWWEL